MTEDNVLREDVHAETDGTSAEAAGELSVLVAEHLQRMPNVVARGLVYLFILLIVAAFVYAAVSEVDMVVSCRAVVRPRDRELRVVADRSGHIERIAGRDGQAVAPGDLLFELQSREATSHRADVDSLETAVQLRKEAVAAGRAALDSETALLNVEHEKSVSVMQLQIERREIERASLDADVAYWSREAKDLHVECLNTETLFTNRLTSIAEYNAVKSRFERARLEVDKLKTQKRIFDRQDAIQNKELAAEKASYEANRRVLAEKRTRLEIDHRVALNAIESDLGKHRALLALMDGGEGSDVQGTTVRAAIAGVVSETRPTRVGDYVTQGDVLCTIVPTNAELEVELAVPNARIAFVEPGLTVKYKVDAFPYRDYGMLRGVVLSVSPGAVGEGDVYAVRGSLDCDHYDVEGRRYPLKPGMSATAELVTETKSILAVVIDRLRE